MGVRVLSPLPTNHKQLRIMEKNLVKADIGEFFAKMYKANKGKRIEVSLQMDSDKICIYYKDRGSFDYINLMDENPSVSDIVESVSE